MTDAATAAIVRTWQRQREYAQRLVADLNDRDMLSQPVPGVVMNHPAWTFAHIALYPPVLAAILRSQSFRDPLDSPYGRGSRPSSDPGAYPPKGKLMADYFSAHDDLESALRDADPALLARPIPLARWEQRFPLIGDAVVHLMLHHESAHLGQISAWRRAGGRPPV
jgi:hypothetical protein